MTTYLLLLIFVIVLFITLLLVLCICLGKHIKNSRIRKHCKQSKIVKDQETKYSTRRIEIKNEDQTKNNQEPLKVNYNREPKYANEILTDKDAEYIDPISSTYYNFDYCKCSLYGNIFNPNKQCSQSEYEMIDYQNTHSLGRK
ncbi:uncharacterized protein LOC143816276 [Ranitomeya variabilis]|uniref:uncharacterized protein LOC143816276 n=1 Tax=Ranitomeya variabilis TaxID=490064 RepID=UPI004056F243